ncbi:MAG: leucine-rich repeat domain-containing protein, partial [Clostridia bacterium]|nr:leucine-rich repeat domain-containing protein [Clostridia bacterium]
MTKKHKRILVLFVLLGLVMCFTAFSLILINYFQPPETPKNLKVENEVLFWDAVPRASVYEIDIDGAIFESKENQLSLLPMIDSYKTYSIQVSAEGKNKRYSDWSEPYTYEVVEPDGFYESLGLFYDNDMVTLTSVGNPKGKIIIPSMINGIVVEQIGFEAFKGRSGITSLYVPSTVKSIKGYAFEYCYGLQRVYLDSVEEMEGGVFDRCTSLEYAFVGNCKDIPGYCFKSCEKLRQAEGRYAFQSLGRGAFFNCDSLTSFHASAQLHNIKYEVFACCKNLRTLTVDAANPIYRSEGNCIIRKEDNAVVQGCEGSVIPKGVTAIDPCAFYGVELERVVIPDGVVSIGRNAFMSASLEQVVIPEGIKSIEPGTFDNCQRLTDVQLPNGLEAIGE